MKKVWATLIILAVAPWTYMVMKLVLCNRVTGPYVRYWDWACDVVVKTFK